MEKAKKPYDNRFFKVVIQQCEKSKKGFLAKLTDTICVRKGEKRAFPCTLSVLANVFLDQNSVKQKTL